MQQNYNRAKFVSKKSDLGCDGPRHLGEETEHRLREGLMWNIMLQEQHFLLSVLLSCTSQTADKVTLKK